MLAKRVSSVGGGLERTLSDFVNELWGPGVAISKGKRRYGTYDRRLWSCGFGDIAAEDRSNMRTSLRQISAVR